FGVLVPFWASSHTFAQPPIARRSTHAHWWHEGSMMGVPTHLPVPVSQVSPGKQSASLRQPTKTQKPLVVSQTKSGLQARSLVQPGGPPATHLPVPGSQNSSAAQSLSTVQTVPGNTHWSVP